jgi:adenine-specific DNA-methyltransferase
VDFSYLFIRPNALTYKPGAMNKPDLIQKIKQPEGITLTPEEQSYLLDLINTKKKYGLVWEEKPEDAEVQLRTHLPVLTEVVEKRIKAKPKTSEPGTKKSEPGFPGLKDGLDFKKSQPLQPTLFAESENPNNPENSDVPENLLNLINPGSDICPNHILIEGDNLHALTALSFTHEGKIDVIYIDPPYNTGNKDFKYNDSYVDKEDSYRHSKWLSFMQKRLLIAKRLLSDKGVIFISIDDNEQAQLKLLCDEVFGEMNFIAENVWEKIHSIKNDAKYLSVNHEYLMFYSKNIENISINLLERTGEMDSRYKNPDNDFRGPWQSGDLAANETRKEGNYDVVNPKTGKIFNVPAGKHWVYSQGNMIQLIEENRIWFGKDGTAFPRKKRFLTDVKEGRKGTTWWESDEVGHNQEAKRELKEFFEQSEDLFSTPKPLRLINRVLKLSSNSSSIILDFFAGSGTTLHATMQLNAEDGGNRQCILVTNNENKICEEVTYERNRRVIQGYSNSKGEWVQGLTSNNLRYYKTALVPGMRDEPNKRLLTQTSTDLLCIKENCYTELTETAGFKPTQCRIFTNEGGKYLMIVFHSRKQLEVYEQLITYIKSIGKLSENIKLYAFSPEKETLLEDFAEVAESIAAVPLPEAIYNAYRATFRTLKLDKKPLQATHDQEAGDES